MDAVQNMGESSSVEGKILKQSGNQLAKVWLGAYDEALSGEIKDSIISPDNSRFSKMLNEFGMEPLSEDLKFNIRSRGDIYVENGTQLLNAIHEARTNPNEKRSIFVGQISEKTKSILEREAKRKDIFKKGEYAFGVRSDDIRHFDEHFTSDEDIAFALYDVYRMLIVNDKVTAINDPRGHVKLEIKYNTNTLELTTATELSKNKESSNCKKCIPDFRNNKKLASD